VGAGAVEQGGVLHAFVLASVRRAELDPFPRETPAGGAAELSGSSPAACAPRACS
jgi:hypothetical protein